MLLSWWWLRHGIWFRRGCLDFQTRYFSSISSGQNILDNLWFFSYDIPPKEPDPGHRLWNWIRVRIWNDSWSCNGFIFNSAHCVLIVCSDQLLRPRPGFPLAPGQTHLGPLVLDKDKKIMVPAALNTYLRDYQRDGVRFFWQQYQEGRGGLLGDDMGLVRDFACFMEWHRRLRPP